jgi:hypothetical protein
MVTMSLTGAPVATTTASAVTHCAAASRDTRAGTPLDALDVRVAEAASSPTLDRGKETPDVLDDVELRLIGEAKCRPGIVRREGSPLDPPYAAQPGSLRGFELAVEQLGRLIGSETQVAIEPGEVAVDVLALDDRFDRGNRLSMARRGEAGAFGAVQSLELAIAHVERAHEVRRRTAGLAAARGTLVEHHDGACRLGGGSRRRIALRFRRRRCRRRSRARAAGSLASSR